MAKAIEAPCRNCHDRHFGCHGECEKYQKYNAQMNVIRAERADAIEAYFAAGCSERTRKKFEKKGKGRY